MKLRIKGSSLRLRLTQGEVRRLETEGEVAEQINFGAGVRLTYRLTAEGVKPSITATYANDVIDVRVPRESVASLAQTADQVARAHGETVCGGSLRKIHVTSRNWRGPIAD